MECKTCGAYIKKEYGNKCPYCGNEFLSMGEINDKKVKKIINEKDKDLQNIGLNWNSNKIKSKKYNTFKNYFVIFLECILIFLCFLLWKHIFYLELVFTRDIGIIIYFIIVPFVTCCVVYGFYKWDNNYTNFCYIDIFASIPLSLFLYCCSFLAKALTLFICIDIQMSYDYQKIGIDSNIIFLLGAIFFIPVGFLTSRNIRVGG